MSSFTTPMHIYYVCVRILLFPLFYFTQAYFITHYKLTIQEDRPSFNLFPKRVFYRTLPGIIFYKKMAESRKILDKKQTRIYLKNHLQNIIHFIIILFIILGLKKKHGNSDINSGWNKTMHILQLKDFRRLFEIIKFHYDV